MADVVKYERLDQNGDSESIQDGEERTEAAHQLTIESNNSVTTSEKKERWYVRQSLCCRRSWKAILFGLLVFAVALMISFVITLLVKEPTRPQYNGNYSVMVTCNSLSLRLERVWKATGFLSCNCKLINMIDTSQENCVY